MLVVVPQASQVLAAVVLVVDHSLAPAACALPGACFAAAGGHGYVS